MKFISTFLNTLVALAHFTSLQIDDLLKMMWKDINGFLKDLRAYPEHFHKTDNKSLNLNSVPKSESTSKKKKKSESTTKPWIFQATFKSLKENNFSIFSWTKVHPNGSISHVNKTLS